MGLDTLGLGCWVCTRHQGKHNLTLRVISAYIPCTTNSIYHQHQRYLDRKKDGRTPRQSIIEDLCTDIVQWREICDQIILMVGLN